MIQKNKLLKGWKEVTLGEILNYEQPTKYIVSSEDYSEEYKIPVLTAGKTFLLGHTNEKEGIYNKLPVIIFDDFTTASKFVTFPFKVKSSAMKLLTPKMKDVDLKYIFFLMQTIKVDSSSHKRYYLSKYQSIKIALPPLQIQQKIVSILEKAEQTKEWRKKADELTNEFLKLMLYNFLKFPNIHIKQKFHNTDKNLPKGFIWKRLSEVCLDIADIDHKMPEAVQNGVPFISAKDLTDEGDILFNNTKYISHADFKRLSRKIKPGKGDIIYSRIGTVGRAAIVKVNIDFLPSYSCCTIKPNLKIVNGEYLACCLNSNIVLMQAHHGTRGIGVPDLGMKEIKDFLVPLPPIELQSKFASIIKEIEHIKEQQKMSREYLNNLFNFLMQKAFKGDLMK